MNFPDEMLSKMWDEFDWKTARKKVFKAQQLLTLAVFHHNSKEIIRLTDEIVNSLNAKALAVKKVSEELDSAPGIDNIKWITSSEKMKATFSLNKKDYKAQPYKSFVFKDHKAGKERRINIPTTFDRAMQILYAMALDPISEATADRKSFAFRKGRSALDAHSSIINLLKEKNAPKWFLICDIKSYYDTINHDWLLNHIPINKHVLKEFIKAGIIMNNELFPNDVGISLGSNISTIIGNMTLDGIQRKIYNMQNKVPVDYLEGYTIRFADDILIASRTKEQVQRYLQFMKDFASERGLQLSPEKTCIKNINQGFDFLSRFYYKSDFQIHSTPSKKAIKQMENELYDLVLNNETKWSQKRLILTLNSKLSGWASYHRITEANDAFRHIDVLVSALLLNLTKKMHPQTPIQKIIKKYWQKDEKNRDIFTLTTNKSIKVIKLEDVILVEHNKLNLKYNVYLDTNYFQDRCNSQEIQKISGKYKKIWERQEGICYYCGKKIKPYQYRRIVYKNLTKDTSIKNMAYIHTSCFENEIIFVNSTYNEAREIDINELISTINNSNVKKSLHKKGKYYNLYQYFANCTKYTFCISFKEIEKIIDNQLCKSLYEHENYWWQRKQGLISSCWLENGYIIKKIYLKEQKITFIREKKQSAQIEIPKQLLSSNIPKSAKYELEQFFTYIIEKYGL